MFELQDAVATFKTMDLNDEQRLKDRQGMLGIRRMRGIAASEFMAVAVTMWADRYEGVDDKGLPLSLTDSRNDMLHGEGRIARYQYIHEYVRNRDTDWLKGA